MRPGYEFLLHAIEERQGAHDVDATLARLGTQGWSIVGVTMATGGRLLVALQRPLGFEDHGLEPLEEAGAVPLAAPNVRELERLPTLDLPGAEADAPRAALVAQLGAYRPAGAREGAMHARMLQFVSRNVDALTRERGDGHVTASAWIVDAARTHALLIHHRKLDRWLQPGGHLERADRDVADAALREAREETGLRSLRLAARTIFDLDVHAIPARGAERAHDHYDVRFLVEADATEAPQLNEESHAARWFTVAELFSNRVDESVRRLARKTFKPNVTVS